MSPIPERIATRASTRFSGHEAVRQRRKVTEAVKQGTPLRAEADPLRAAAAFRRGGAEVVQGQTVDFLDVSVLETARRRADAVARVIFRDGRPQGTGFMISDRLFLTNNHVLESAAAAGGFLAEFDYELALGGKPRAATSFAFAPAEFFLTDDVDDLDYTVVAVGRKISGARELADYGRIALSSSPTRHAVGEFVSIIQHPNGDFKKIALHENRIVTRLDKVLHYITDTLPGSSGSPVFNLNYEAVALHHWGAPHRQTTYPDGRPVNLFANEGTRVSAIVAELRDALPGLPPTKAAMLRAAIQDHESTDPETGIRSETTADGATIIRRVLPIEIVVRVPRIGGGGAGPVPSAAPLPDPAVAPVAVTGEGVEIDPNYSNRRGYDPKFLSGFAIPLPKLTAEQRKLAALNRQPSAGKDPWVLDYEHFSIAINGARRTAFYCATNIDGKTWKNLNRKTGAISESAEAREKWYAESRLDETAQANDDDYKPYAQFHRGHLVRRQYPSWGDEPTVRRADADTFHFTNCALQHGQFNPNTSRWLGLEDYVLDNARKDDVRVSVFSGPIFKASDPKFGRLRAPLEFWKVVARLDEDGLSVMALRASQAKLVKARPEKFGEAFRKLPAKLEGYQVTVAAIEAATGLSFGNLKKYDVLAGAPEAAKRLRPIRTVSDYVIRRRGR